MGGYLAIKFAVVEGAMTKDETQRWVLLYLTRTKASKTLEDDGVKVSLEVLLRPGSGRRTEGEGGRMGSLG